MDPVDSADSVILKYCLRIEKQNHSMHFVRASTSREKMHCVFFLFNSLRVHLDEDQREGIHDRRPAAKMPKLIYSQCH